jgi:hypothetical protein
VDVSAARRLLRPSSRRRWPEVVAPARARPKAARTGVRWWRPEATAVARSRWRPEVTVIATARRRRRPEATVFAATRRRWCDVDLVASAM